MRHLAGAQTKSRTSMLKVAEGKNLIDPVLRTASFSKQAPVKHRATLKQSIMDWGLPHAIAEVISLGYKNALDLPLKFTSGH